MLLFVACTTTPTDTAPPGCMERIGEGSDPTSEADVAALLEAVRPLHPELEDVEVTLHELSSETDFYQAALDVATMDDPPLERAYRVLYNPLQFERDIPRDAVGAILVHELQHLVDYTEMDGEQLSEFALWYASEDISAYERRTDEAALWAGCGEGLIAYREWLYAQLTPEQIEQKKVTYYTPEEIEAWTAANE